MPPGEKTDCSVAVLQPAGEVAKECHLVQLKELILG